VPAPLPQPPTAEPLISEPTTAEPPISGPHRSAVDAAVARHAAGLVELRRDLHAHPELSHAERRTTEVIRTRLLTAGLQPVVLPHGTGLTCDLGADPRAAPHRGTLVALRADLDALPVADEKDVPYRSTVAGLCHACGHDVHTAVVVGAGLVLAELAAAGLLEGRVRLIFQPAEEATPGGALDVMAAGGLDGVGRIFTVHCDPRHDVGAVGLRVGPITGSADHVLVRLTGPGGHTARPHLTADLVYALGRVITDVPAVLSRRVDPRAGLSLVWGRVEAGAAANAIPRTGQVDGTIRALDATVWELAPGIVEDAIRGVVAPYGVGVEIEYRRGVPPVVNEAVSVERLAQAARELVGDTSVFETEQSLGGEDFAWYLGQVPGALARLGVRRPGDPLSHDLHQGSFDVDERAIQVGVRLLVGAALLSVS
jgi:amidohydrolase